MLKLAFLRDAIMPMERAADYLPKIIIKDSAVDAVCHGADLACGGIASLADNIQKNDIVAIETLKGELVGAGHSLLTSTHCTINTPAGFLPGLPIWVLEQLQPDLFILIEAHPDEIIYRRSNDETRSRDVQKAKDIQLHQEMNIS